MRTFGRVVLDDGSVAYAVEEGDVATLLSDAPWLGGEPTETCLKASSAHWLAPVSPSKVICVGKNYQAHAQEMGGVVPPEPLLFFKPPSAVIGHGEPIVMPAESERVDHEGEMGVVIAKQARNVSAADALDYVFGYTCVNDVTARDLQRKDNQWARAKGFDTFCPVGPRVVCDLDPTHLLVRCLVNGGQRQVGNTADMAYPVAYVIEYISHIMTLEPGDLLVTGTPEGVGPLQAGDEVVVEVSGVGSLSNPVVAAGD